MHWHGWLWQEGSSNGLATEVSVSLRVCPSSIDLVLQHLRNHTKKCWWLQSPCAPYLTLWSHRNKRDSISEKQRISTSQKVINQSILCFLMFIRFLISLSSLVLVVCGLIICGTNLSSLVYESSWCFLSVPLFLSAFQSPWLSFCVKFICLRPCLYLFFHVLFW